MGESFFKDELKKDTKFWDSAGDQWGRGYTDSVRQVNKEWFSEPSHRAVEALLEKMLETEWNIALGKVRSILPLD